MVYALFTAGKIWLKTVNIRQKIQTLFLKFTIMRFSCFENWFSYSKCKSNLKDSYLNQLFYSKPVHNIVIIHWNSKKDRGNELLQNLKNCTCFVVDAKVLLVEDDCDKLVAKFILFMII